MCVCVSGTNICLYERWCRLLNTGYCNSCYLYLQIQSVCHDTYCIACVNSVIEQLKLLWVRKKAIVKKNNFRISKFRIDLTRKLCKNIETTRSKEMTENSNYILEYLIRIWNGNAEKADYFNLSAPSWLAVQPTDWLLVILVVLSAPF